MTILEKEFMEKMPTALFKIAQELKRLNENLEKLNEKNNNKTENE